MEEKLTELLNKFNITYEENFKNKLDSMKIITLIMEIEEIYKIEIKNIDFNKHNNVKKIINEFVND